MAVILSLINGFKTQGFVQSSPTRKPFLNIQFFPQNDWAISSVTGICLVCDHRGSSKM